MKGKRSLGAIRHIDGLRAKPAQPDAGDDPIPTSRAHATLAKGAGVEVLQSAFHRDGDFLTKATIVQLRRLDAPAAPKPGMPVIVTPFLTTQNSSDAVRAFAMSFRSAGTGCSPSENLAQPTPGPPWQFTQPIAA